MSEIPPVNEPSQPVAPIPPPIGDFSAPPQYAGYTRPTGFVGSPDHLEAVADGYYGLNWVFLFTLVWALGGFGLVGLASQNADRDGLFVSFLYLGFIILTIPVVALVSYKPVKKLAFGMNWSPTMAIFISIAIGFGVLCIGLIAFVILQVLAGAEIRKYPIKKNFLGGFTRKNIRALVAEMRASPQYRQQQAAARTFQP